MITVYGRATSSNVQAVMWGIGELGLEYRRLDYGLNFGGNDTPEYLAMNPHGLVPTIKDGDLVLWESCAILRYLASKYGDGGVFWPSDPAARVRTAAKDRDMAALTAALAWFDGLFGQLEAQPGHNPYVAGADFTLADIVIGHVLFRYYDIDIPRQPRPAFREHVMVSYETLRAKGAD